MRCSRWASASSRSARSRRGRRRAIRSRACSACRSTARSSTASASTTTASMRWCATSSARSASDGLLGINIGKNKDTPNESARGRLPVLPGARVSAGRLHHRQHLLAQHRRPARTAGRAGAAPPGRHAARGAGAPGRAARQARADAGEDRARTCPTTTSMPPARVLGDLRRRRRHRHQHHDRRASRSQDASPRATKPAACPASR